MLLSEVLQPKQKEVKIKTIKVKKVRDLLIGGECFETLNGKKVYIRQNNQWFTCMGNKPLIHNFIIVEKDEIIICVKIVSILFMIIAQASQTVKNLTI